MIILWRDGSGGGSGSGGDERWYVDTKTLFATVTNGLLTCTSVVCPRAADGNRTKPNALLWRHAGGDHVKRTPRTQQQLTTAAVQRVPSLPRSPVPRHLHANERRYRQPSIRVSFFNLGPQARIQKVNPVCPGPPKMFQQ